MSLRRGLLPQGRSVFGEVVRYTSGMHWGPNAQYRPGQFFVGVHPHPMKYYGLHKKKPNMPYGIQGVNHLLPEKGKVALKLPVKMKLKKDHIYIWCNCGHSGRQPLCDGTHNRLHIPTRMKPVRFIPDKDMEVWFCQCKQSNNRPFCDGSHRNIKDDKEISKEELLGTST